MSTADELIKLQKLLNDGALSQDEFDKQKNKLLYKSEKEAELQSMQDNIIKNKNNPENKKKEKKGGKLKWVGGAVVLLLIIASIPSSESSSSNSSSSNSSSSNSSSSNDWGSCTLSSYGSLSTQSLDGVGDNIITWGGNGGIATFSHSGSGYVSLTTYDIAGGYLDLLVNEVGVYSGSHLFGIWADEDVEEFEIEAESSWKLTLQSVSTGAKKVSGTSVSGDGPEVVNATSVCEYTKIQATHNGSSNFTIWAISPKGPYSQDLLVNDIGNYSGTVRLPENFELLQIESDGSWKITFLK